MGGGIRATVLHLFICLLFDSEAGFCVSDSAVGGRPPLGSTVSFVGKLQSLPVGHVITSRNVLTKGLVVG